MLGIAETNEKIPKTIECLIMANSANTSCLFDNSSVKLCKHDTPLLFAPSGANHEQGLGWDRVCEAQRSNESPSGAFKRQRGLR